MDIDMKSLEAEFAAVGLGDIPKSIGSDGVLHEIADESKRADVESVIAAHLGNSFERAKVAAKKRADEACQTYIYKHYSQAKQNNITNWKYSPDGEFTEAMCITMVLFIKEARSVCSYLKSAVDACQTPEELQEIIAMAEAQYANDISI